MAQYHLLILPNTTRYYFTQVFSVLEHPKNKTAVITLDPKYLLSECPNSQAQFICRISEDGTVLSKQTLLQQVREANPDVLVLDDCFWEEDDGHLLNDMLELQNVLTTLQIINIQQHSSPSSWKNISFAHRIRFPASLVRKATFQSNTYPVSLYENDEALVPRSNTTLLESPSSPDIYKQIFDFYQRLHTIRCLTEMDLFCMFLRQLNERHLNKHLLHLFAETHRYSFYGELLPNRAFSSTFITWYITIINHIVFVLIQTNEPLFREIRDFFTPKTL